MWEIFLAPRVRRKRSTPLLLRSAAAAAALPVIWLRILATLAAYSPACSSDISMNSAATTRGGRMCACL